MKETRHSDVPKSNEDIVLDGIAPAAKEFAQKLYESIVKKRTAWHRLYVKVENGHVKQQQTESGTVHAVIEVAKDGVDATVDSQ